MQEMSFDAAQVWLTGLLLLLVGLLAGYVARGWQARQRLRELRDQLLKLGEQKGEVERDLARSQSEAQGLRERLADVRETLETREQALQASTQRLNELEKEFASLSATHAEKMAGHAALQKSLEEASMRLRTEFQNLANQILEEKGRSLAQNNHVALDALLKPFREQIQGFQQRVNEVHAESIKGHATLGAEIRQVLEIGLKMSAEANTLASALKGEKKTLGKWGESQLEQTLQAAGLVPGEHYETQVRYRDEAGASFLPDFVVKLPDGKHLILDSKVSLVDYERAVGADTDEARRLALDAHVKAVRNHMDDLSRKDYTQLIGIKSPDFVLMFLPIEAAYMAALQHNPELFNHGYQRHVIMVSHTTLMPILKTVANLWRVARSNEEAHKLSALAGDIYNQIVVVAEHLKKLGDTLGTASNHYNRTVVALAGRQGLYGKAQRFTELSVKASKNMPEMPPLEADLQKDRLEIIRAEAPEAPVQPSQLPAAAGEGHDAAEDGAKAQAGKSDDVQGGLGDDASGAGCDADSTMDGGTSEENGSARVDGQD